MLSRRRRQNSLVICLLFGMGGCVYSELRARQLQAVSYGSPAGRKLLHVIVHVSDLILSYLELRHTWFMIKHISEQFKSFFAKHVH